MNCICEHPESEHDDTFTEVGCFHPQERFRDTSLLCECPRFTASGKASGPRKPGYYGKESDQRHSSSDDELPMQHEHPGRS